MTLWRRYGPLFVCLSCPVCDVGVLWPNGWMDQDETWHWGRPRPRPHSVRWGPSPPSKGAQCHSSPSFQPMSIVAKRSSITAAAEHLSFITLAANIQRETVCFWAHPRTTVLHNWYDCCSASLTVFSLKTIWVYPEYWWWMLVIFKLIFVSFKIFKDWLILKNKIN